MKKLFRKIYNKCIKCYLPQSFQQKLKRADSIEYPIVKNPEEIFEKIYHIKDATWETEKMPEIYGMCKRYTYTIKHPAQDILLLSEARITPESDVVLTPQGVVWDKFYLPMFPYMEIADSNVASYDSETIRIRKPEQKIHVEGACVSMIGALAELWVHFLVQFFPKLYYAEEAGLLDQDMTLVIPDYKDTHIDQLVSDVLMRHPKCKVRRIEKSLLRREILCDQLYWIPTAAAESNEGIFPTLLHHALPQRVKDVLQTAFAKYIEEANNSKGTPAKIYLVRKGSYRCVRNIDEVENFFREEGFAFVEPHKMPLQEKVNLFRNAKIIAGSHSSAWGNAMVCEGAKGLMLTPISWSMDGLVGALTPPEACRIIQVPGYEDYKEHQNDYHISMDALREAYKQLLSE